MPIDLEAITKFPANKLPSIAELNAALFADGVEKGAQQALRKLPNVAETCSVDWFRRGPAIQCFTCQRDSHAIICLPCFFNGNHNGHCYQLMLTEGGYCDCGDPNSWDPNGFCSQHCGLSLMSKQAALDSLPRALRLRVEKVVSAVVAQLFRSLVSRVNCNDILRLSSHTAHESKRASFLTIDEEYFFNSCTSILKWTTDLCNTAAGFQFLLSEGLEDTLLELIVLCEPFFPLQCRKQLTQLLKSMMGYFAFKIRFFKILVKRFPLEFERTIRRFYFVDKKIQTLEVGIGRLFSYGFTDPELVTTCLENNVFTLIPLWYRLKKTLSCSPRLELLDIIPSSVTMSDFHVNIVLMTWIFHTLKDCFASDRGVKYIVNSMLKADEKKMLQSNAEMETVISLLLFCHTALEKQAQSQIMTADRPFRLPLAFAHEFLSLFSRFSYVVRHHLPLKDAAVLCNAVAIHVRGLRTGGNRFVTLDNLVHLNAQFHGPLMQFFVSLVNPAFLFRLLEKPKPLTMEEQRYVDIFDPLLIQAVLFMAVRNWILFDAMQHQFCVDYDHQGTELEHSFKYAYALQSFDLAAIQLAVRVLSYHYTLNQQDVHSRASTRVAHTMCSLQDVKNATGNLHPLFAIFSLYYDITAGKGRLESPLPKRVLWDCIAKMAIRDCHYRGYEIFPTLPFPDFYRIQSFLNLLMHIMNEPYLLELLSLQELPPEFFKNKLNILEALKFHAPFLRTCLMYYLSQHQLSAKALEFLIFRKKVPPESFNEILQEITGTDLTCTDKKQLLKLKTDVWAHVDTFLSASCGRQTLMAEEAWLLFGNNVFSPGKWYESQTQALRYPEASLMGPPRSSGVKSTVFQFLQNELIRSFTGNAEDCCLLHLLSSLIEARAMLVRHQDRDHNLTRRSAVLYPPLSTSRALRKFYAKIALHVVQPDGSYTSHWDRLYFKFDLLTTKYYFPEKNVARILKRHLRSISEDPALDTRKRTATKFACCNAASESPDFLQRARQAIEYYLKDFQYKEDDATLFGTLSDSDPSPMPMCLFVLRNGLICAPVYYATKYINTRSHVTVTELVRSVCNQFNEQLFVAEENVQSLSKVNCSFCATPAATSSSDATAKRDGSLRIPKTVLHSILFSIVMDPPTANQYRIPADFRNNGLILRYIFKLLDLLFEQHDGVTQLTCGQNNSTTVETDVQKKILLSGANSCCTSGAPLSEKKEVAAKLIRCLSVLKYYASRAKREVDERMIAALIQRLHRRFAFDEEKMGAFLSSCLSDRNEVQDAPLENDNLSVERSNEALVKQRQCLEVIKKQQAAFLLRLQQKALLPNSDVEVVPPEMNLVSVCQTEEVSNREGSEQVMICSFCREPAKAKDPLSLVVYVDYVDFLRRSAIQGRQAYPPDAPVITTCGHVMHVGCPKRIVPQYVSGRMLLPAAFGCPQCRAFAQFSLPYLSNFLFYPNLSETCTTNLISVPPLWSPTPYEASGEASLLNAAMVSNQFPAVDPLQATTSPLMPLQLACIKFGAYMFNYLTEGRPLEEIWRTIPCTVPFSATSSQGDRNLIETYPISSFPSTSYVVYSADDYSSSSGSSDSSSRCANDVGDLESDPDSVEYSVIRRFFDNDSDASVSVDSDTRSDCDFQRNDSLSVSSPSNVHDGNINTIGLDNSRSVLEVGTVSQRSDESNTLSDEDTSSGVACESYVQESVERGNNGNSNSVNSHSSSSSENENQGRVTIETSLNFDENNDTVDTSGQSIPETSNGTPQAYDVAEQETDTFTDSAVTAYAVGSEGDLNSLKSNETEIFFGDLYYSSANKAELKRLVELYSATDGVTEFMTHYIGNLLPILDVSRDSRRQENEKKLTELFGNTDAALILLGRDRHPEVPSADELFFPVVMNHQLELFNRICMPGWRCDRSRLFPLTLRTRNVGPKLSVVACWQNVVYVAVQVVEEKQDASFSFFKNRFPINTYSLSFESTTPNEFCCSTTPCIPASDSVADCVPRKLKKRQFIRDPLTNNVVADSGNPAEKWCFKLLNQYNALPVALRHCASIDHGWGLLYAAYAEILLSMSFKTKEILTQEGTSNAILPLFILLIRNGILCRCGATFRLDEIDFSLLQMASTADNPLNFLITDAAVSSPLSSCSYWLSYLDVHPEIGRMRIVPNSPWSCDVKLEFLKLFLGAKLMSPFAVQRVTLELLAIQAVLVVEATILDMLAEHVVGAVDEYERGVPKHVCDLLSKELSTEFQRGTLPDDAIEAFRRWGSLCSLYRKTSHPVWYENFFPSLRSFLPEETENEASDESRLYLESYVEKLLTHAMGYDSTLIVPELMAEVFGHKFKPPDIMRRLEDKIAHSSLNGPKLDRMQQILLLALVDVCRPVPRLVDLIPETNELISQTEHDSKESTLYRFFVDASKICITTCNTLRESTTSDAWELSDAKIHHWWCRCYETYTNAAQALLTFVCWTVSAVWSFNSAQRNLIWESASALSNKNISNSNVQDLFSLINIPSTFDGPQSDLLIKAVKLMWNPVFCKHIQLCRVARVSSSPPTLTSMGVPRFVKLPEHFEGLLKELHTRACVNCGVVDRVSLAYCLTCGSTFCSDSCTQSKKLDESACEDHIECCGGQGVFILPYRQKTIALSKGQRLNVKNLYSRSGTETSNTSTIAHKLNTKLLAELQATYALAAMDRRLR